jgi:hypothetical protein
MMRKEPHLALASVDNVNTTRPRNGQRESRKLRGLHSAAAHHLVFVCHVAILIMQSLLFEAFKEEAGNWLAVRIVWIVNGREQGTLLYRGRMAYHCAVHVMPWFAVEPSRLTIRPPREPAG